MSATPRSLHRLDLLNILIFELEITPQKHRVAPVGRAWTQ